MSLQLHELHLRNFRNYEEYYCCDLKELNIFVGPNAIGKTNIIEAISLLTSISSFRNPLLSQLIGPYQDVSYITSFIGDNLRNLDFELRITKEKKIYSLNKKEKPASQLRGIIPSVSFTPDDLFLVKKTNSYRRRALDILGSQLSVNYSVIKRDFEKCLREKNNLLKEEVSNLYLESVNETFIFCAAQFFCYRLSLFNKLNPYLCVYYQKLSQTNEMVEARYIPSWETINTLANNLHFEENNYTTNTATSPEKNLVNPHDKKQVQDYLVTHIEKLLPRERAAQTSLIGPHKDSISFYINGRDARVFGSQGQQRCLVLAWKLAEASLIEELLDTKPLLLLDDVMSELDKNRRQKLMKFVLQNTQTFLTTTNLSYFSDDILDRSNIIRLNNK